MSARRARARQALVRRVRWSRASRGAELPHDFALVERLLLGSDHLIRLVALPREQDRVAQARQLERLRDRGAAVRETIVGTAPHPGLDLVEDALRVLRARVVGRGDRDVGEARRGRTHWRPFAAVAVPPGAEYDDHPAAGRRDVPRGLERPLERVGGVRVITQYRARV